MWVNQAVLFWPVFGWEIEAGASPYWALAWERALSDPWRWIKELAGLGYLVWLWFSVGLNDGERRAEFFSSGRLPERTYAAETG